MQTLLPATPLEFPATTLETPMRVGIFSSIEVAERVVGELLDAGFSKEQITVICSNDTREAHFRQFEHQKSAGSYAGNASLAGGAIGAVLGGLTAIAGVVATGGIGLLAAGPILVGAGGVTGTFVGAMLTRGVEKELADFYDQSVIHGKILIAAECHGVDCRELLALASHIFANAGAEPVTLPEAPV